MKKCKTMILGLATVALATLVGGTLAAQAADTGTDGTSVGEFTVASGKLSLDAVPTLAFKGTDVASLASGTKLAYNSDAVTGSGKTSTGNTLTVSDFRGADNAAWNLTAQLSNFTNGSSTVAGTIDYAGANAAKGTISADGGNVWNNTSAATGGTSSVSAATDSTTALTLPATATAVSGTYDADITWTLSATASAE